MVFTDFPRGSGAFLGIFSMTLPLMVDRILDFYTFIPFLQDVQSVFQDASVQVTEGLVLKVENRSRCLCTGNRGFDTNRYDFLLKAIAFFYIIQLL